MGVTEGDVEAVRLLIKRTSQGRRRVHWNFGGDVLRRPTRGNSHRVSTKCERLRRTGTNLGGHHDDCGSGGPGVDKLDGAPENDREFRNAESEYLHDVSSHGGIDTREGSKHDSDSIGAAMPALTFLSLWLTRSSF